MSGGSMDYLYARVNDASFYLNTPERRAFKKHLELVSKALKAIEWVDSSDSSEGSEVADIMAVITPQAVLQETIEAAVKASNDLSDWIEKAKYIKE